MKLRQEIQQKIICEQNNIYFIYRLRNWDRLGLVKIVFVRREIHNNCNFYIVIDPKDILN